MAKFEGYICDITGKVIPRGTQPITIGVVYGRSMDAAGSMDDDYMELHLSSEGAQQALKMAISCLDYEGRQDLLKRLKISTA